MKSVIYLFIMLFCIDLCSSQRHQVENTDKTFGSQESEDQEKVTRVINETLFFCINGTTVLNFDDGNHERPNAVYWSYNYSSNVIVSDVRGRLSNTSDARYIYNNITSALTVQNLSNSDYLFVYKSVYSNEDIIIQFHLKEYGPINSVFQGYGSRQCEEFANENGMVNAIFIVKSSNPDGTVTVDCELNGQSVGTKQYMPTNTDDENVMYIIINTEIDYSQNLTCTVSGPATCNRKQQYVCQFNSSNLVVGIFPAFIFAVIIGISFGIGLC